MTEEENKKWLNKVHLGSCFDLIKQLPDESVDVIISSPPYYALRDYQVEGQFGQEKNFDEYVNKLCELFFEAKRVLKKSGSIWVNIGDSYSSSGENAGGENEGGETGISWVKNQRRAGKTRLPEKCQLLVPYRFAIKMIDDIGYILRNDIIWWKRNSMPSSVDSRLTKDFEYFFFFVKDGDKYYFEQQFEPMMTNHKKFMTAFGGGKDYGNATYSGNKVEPNPLGRNKRSVWDVPTQVGHTKHTACVDEDTDCLTMNGWKKYNELKIGEIIASFDLKSGLLRWERLEDIYVYDYDGEMIKFNNPFLGGLTVTPNHRMVCQYFNTKKMKHSPFYIRRADEIKYVDEIPVAAQWEPGSFGLMNAPDPKLCEILGWICAEGIFGKYSIDIYQSITVNKPKVDRIEKLLNELKIKYTKRISKHDRYEKYKNNPYLMANFTIAWEDARNIFKYIPYKKPTYEMLLWSNEQISAFIDGFIKGDGHTRKNDGRMSIIQKNEETTDVLMAMCFRLGYRVIKSKTKEYYHKTLHFMRPSCYVLYLNDKTRALVRDSKGINISKIKYTGKVWCPKTPSTTFVARKNGRIIITGNTFPEKLVETPILATCPEFICTKCGKAREKIFNTGDVASKGGSDTGKMAKNKDAYADAGTKTKAMEHREKLFSGEYTDCGCGAPFKPGVVLDVFMGSGTTGLVARKLGRNFIGFELNPEFQKIANDRINEELGLFA